MLTVDRPVLEHKTAATLQRIGIDLGDDRDLVLRLIPFVIDPESLHAIPPLDAAFVRQGHAPLNGIRYRHVTLEPVPVLAPPLARLLRRPPRDIETEFIDGHNVYGANLFGHDEGRRLLRRAIGFVHDEFQAAGEAFDIIAYESDGFLIARQRTSGQSLRDRLHEIIRRMNGGATDSAEHREIRDRLATYYRQSCGDVLAPAMVSHESRDDLTVEQSNQDLETPGTIEERFERLQEVATGVTPLLAAIARRAPQEQRTILTLMEHRIHDPVLHGLAHDLSRQSYRVRAFREPRELMAHGRTRSLSFFRVELVSLLKPLNEHPLGGFPAGNEALKAVYALIVRALQQVLQRLRADSGCEIRTVRRWGDFYVGLDRHIVEACDIREAVDDAFASARYVGIQRARRDDGLEAFSARLLPTTPEDALIAVPLIGVLTSERKLAADLLAMPIEEPGHEKLRVIAKRLDQPSVPDLDMTFLADWTFNACDVNRGIPRLVSLTRATTDDIMELSRYYEHHVNRKGRIRYTLRREPGAIHGFTAALRQLIARNESPS